jgi:hypothetical protein
MDKILKHKVHVEAAVGLTTRQTRLSLRAAELGGGKRINKKRKRNSVK